MKRYSKAYLKSLGTQEKYGSEEHTEVFDDLLKKAVSAKKMSIAEEMNLCSWIEVNQGYDKNPEDCDFCKDYIFRKLYLTYWNNLDGTKSVKGLIRGYSELQEYTPEKKQSDVARLELIHNNWFPNIQRFDHKGDKLLNYVASEANKELKHLQKLFEDGKWGRNVLDLKEKAVSLQSKYIYLTSKSFFEEHKGRIRTKLFEQNIDIDEESMVHILNRHFAGGTKQYDTGKSYHMDKSINVFELPSEIERILSIAHSSGKCTDFQQLLPVKIKGTLYSFCFDKRIEKRKGAVEIEVIRLTSFFPTTEQHNIDNIDNNYTCETITSEIDMYVKK